MAGGGWRAIEIADQDDRAVSGQVAGMLQNDVGAGNLHGFIEIQMRRAAHQFVSIAAETSQGTLTRPAAFRKATWNGGGGAEEKMRPLLQLPG